MPRLEFVIAWTGVSKRSYTLVYQPTSAIEQRLALFNQCNGDGLWVLGALAQRDLSDCLVVQPRDFIAARANERAQRRGRAAAVHSRCRQSPASNDNTRHRPTKRRRTRPIAATEAKPARPLAPSAKSQR
jgi:hypothetical protein